MISDTISLELRSMNAMLYSDTAPRYLLDSSTETSLTTEIGSSLGAVKVIFWYEDSLRVPLRS
jgi:hypothetical protein